MEEWGYNVFIELVLRILLIEYVQNVLVLQFILNEVPDEYVIVLRVKTNFEFDVTNKERCFLHRI